MKKYILFAIALICSSQSFADAPFFDLICKSSNAVRVDLNLKDSGGALASSFSSSQLVVNFRKATSAANIGDGQCSWRDRVLNANEAACFFMNFSGGMTVIMAPRKFTFKDAGATVTASNNSGAITEVEQVKRLSGPAGQRLVLRARNVTPGKCLEVKLF